MLRRWSRAIFPFTARGHAVFPPALLILSLLAMNAHANPLSEGFSASYNLARNGLNLGVANRELKQLEDDRLVFTSSAQPTGLAALLVSDRIDERAVLRLDGDSVRPLAYRYAQTGGRKERHFELFFDWGNGHALGNGNVPRYPLNDQTYDLLSFQLAMMLDLAQGKREFTYAIIDRKRVQDYHAEVVGEEAIRTVAGNVRTLKVRQYDPKRGASFTFWCAIGWDYLPVRIEHREADGDLTVMELRSLSMAGNVRLSDSKAR